MAGWMKGVVLSETILIQFSSIFPHHPHQHPTIPRPYPTQPERASVRALGLLRALSHQPLQRWSHPHGWCEAGGDQV